jgi:hypothetical protein
VLHPDHDATQRALGTHTSEVAFKGKAAASKIFAAVAGQPE